MGEIHIFGVDHFHQSLEAQCVTPMGIEDERQQKSDLAQALREIIDHHDVELVAEEGTLDRPCLGWLLAEERKVGHVDITMPIGEREKQGVKTPEYDREETTRRAAYRIFERYMLERVIEHKAHTVLLICGRRHVGGLAQLFVTAGYNVQPYDINDYPWYRGRPKEGKSGVIGYQREP